MTDAERQERAVSVLGRARRWRYHSAVHVAQALNRLAGEPRGQASAAGGGDAEPPWPDAVFGGSDR